MSRKNFKPESTNPHTIYTRKWRDANPDKMAAALERRLAAGKQSRAVKNFSNAWKRTFKLNDQIKAKHAKGFSTVDLMIWFHLPESRITQALAAPCEKSTLP